MKLEHSLVNAMLIGVRVLLGFLCALALVAMLEIHFCLVKRIDEQDTTFFGFFEQRLLLGQAAAIDCDVIAV